MALSTHRVATKKGIPINHALGKQSDVFLKQKKPESLFSGFANRFAFECAVCLIL